MYHIELHRDQVWFKLKQAPGISFAALYVPPRDSPFFSHESFSVINEHCRNPHDLIILMGDVNARLGPLDCFNDQAIDCTYSTNPDERRNANGNDLRDLMLTNSIKPINGLTFRRHQFRGGLTFRKGRRWVSQIDWAMTSIPVLKHIQSFSVMNDVAVPTDHAPIELILNKLETSASELLNRASDLGESAFSGSRIKAIKIQEVDPTQFVTNLPSTAELWNQMSQGGILAAQEVNDLCTRTAETLYMAASQSAYHNEPTERYDGDFITPDLRWQTIINERDHRKLWQSIDWNGQFDARKDSSKTPSDECFCQYYEDLLKAELRQDFTPLFPKYIPILDDPFDPIEVERAIKQLEAKKAPGLDGIAPGLLKMMDDDWLIAITFLFNSVFDTSYPECWTQAKVFTIFKKGEKLQPGNYRGISILNALGKLYDSVLSSRLQLWYTPLEEQSGATKGRGCSEPILIIRLLIDIARKTRRKLFICFIDFEKAYDKVNRYELMKRLDSRGCGTKFLNALKSSYANTYGRIGSCNFLATAGVRQGACSSCPLFTFLVDSVIEAVQNIGEDDWLGTLHTQMLMDDTAIIATSREKMSQKLELLKNCTDTIGMKIHPAKSQYIVINSDDSLPFHVANIEIKKTDKYQYLGTWISNASIAEQAKYHLKSKANQTFKFSSFLAKNQDAPFPVKRKVWESALLSSLFYSAETWLTNNLKTAEQVYASTLKQLLSVRTTTCTDLCIIEAGEKGATSLIRDRQRQFLKRLRKRENYHQSHIGKTIQLAISVRSPAGLAIDLANQNQDFADAVRASTSSRRVAYKILNPSLERNTVYSACDIKERYRIAFTRLRLSSHNLASEKGRWSRTPPESRLCLCGDVQNDSHVLLSCPLIVDVKRETGCYPDSIDELFQNDPATICRYIFLILELLQ